MSEWLRSAGRAVRKEWASIPGLMKGIVVLLLWFGLGQLWKYFDAAVLSLLLPACVLAAVYFYLQGRKVLFKQALACLLVCFVFAIPTFGLAYERYLLGSEEMQVARQRVDEISAEFGELPPAIRQEPGKMMQGRRRAWNIVEFVYDPAQVTGQELFGLAGERLRSLGWEERGQFRYKRGEVEFTELRRSVEREDMVWLMIEVYASPYEKVFGWLMNIFVLSILVALGSGLLALASRLVARFRGSPEEKGEQG